MTYKVRKAEKKDIPEILLLIQELAAYEKEPEAVEIDEKSLLKDGFGKHPLFTCFVAEVKGKVRGMALVYYRYSTWKGKTIHLEDLIVKKDFRGSGLGSALYKKVMQFAVAEGVKRVEWVVLDWNTPAVEFYKKTGATVYKEWQTVQFDEKAIHQFLSNQ